jgi:hypothetical protein
MWEELAVYPGDQVEVVIHKRDITTGNAVARDRDEAEQRPIPDEDSEKKDRARGDAVGRQL